MPKNCADVKQHMPDALSGEFEIDPAQDGNVVRVFCDLSTDGGGWTRIYASSNEKFQYAEDSERNNMGYAGKVQASSTKSVSKTVFAALKNSFSEVLLTGASRSPQLVPILRGLTLSASIPSVTLPALSSGKFSGPRGRARDRQPRPRRVHPTSWITPPFGNQRLYSRRCAAPGGVIDQFARAVDDLRC